MFIDTILQPVPESSGNLLDGSHDFRPFAECGIAVDVRDVVQVDVNDSRVRSR
jgi:hypothetical protein